MNQRSNQNTEFETMFVCATLEKQSCYKNNMKSTWLPSLAQMWTHSNGKGEVFWTRSGCKSEIKEKYNVSDIVRHLRFSTEEMEFKMK